MIPVALLLVRNGPPPPPWVILFAPIFFFLGSALTHRMLGIPALYAAFPADRSDPIEANLGWLQTDFRTFRGHTPMSYKAGRRCLHLRQPFPFQPAWWRGPASIPWNVIRIEKEIDASRWSFLGAAEFRLGEGGRVIRLRGRAARTLQAKVLEKQGRGAVAPIPSDRAIRPR
ncbi:hypothetical protein [Geothrix sp. 21YS21S-4]|uniref:hypothetical protein n=1 Tax=Geothrix sp. 21YS21S-4 TaxID=3068889 RepID=UPI0027B92FBB|nr:hypothetical protein [Geothrix sp. 21YS21S-4]